MIEHDNPLHVYVDDEGDGLAHYVEPGTGTTLCGRPVGDARRLHGAGTHTYPGCWACLNADPSAVTVSS